METKWDARQQFVLALAVSTIISVGLFSYGALRNQSWEYSYLIWNLFLAWIPLLLAVRLTNVLKTKLWSSWEALVTSLFWLLFLPNSFYMISDFIHLREVPRVDILYDTIVFTSFIYTGVVLGFSSLYLIHQELIKRMGERLAAAWIGVVLLLCSAAMYLGRDLRWNSWDIFVNPGGLLFDVADRLQHPADYPQMLLTVSAFFVLLTTMYGLLWSGARLLRSSPRL